MAQVISNLVGNAITHGESDQPVRLARARGGEERVRSRCRIVRREIAKGKAGRSSSSRSNRARSTPRVRKASASGSTSRVRSSPRTAARSTQRPARTATSRSPCRFLVKPFPPRALRHSSTPSIRRTPSIATPSPSSILCASANRHGAAHDPHERMTRRELGGHAPRSKIPGIDRRSGVEPQAAVAAVVRSRGGPERPRLSESGEGLLRVAGFSTGHFIRLEHDLDEAGGLDRASHCSRCG